MTSTTLATRAQAGLDSLRGAGITPQNRREMVAMGLGLGALFAAVAWEGAQALLAPAPPGPEVLAAAMATTSFEGEACPNGWAETHAAGSALTEAQVSAWYVSESFRATDGEIIRDAAAFLDAPEAHLADGRPATETQIALCIAESRRLL